VDNAHKRLGYVRCPESKDPSILKGLYFYYLNKPPINRARIRVIATA
jgi:hypothetical protein